MSNRISCSNSTSGYDFGYLLRILTCEPLPATENDFFRLLFIWFPCIYDIKHVVRSVKTLRGGLQEIAESLGVRTLSFERLLICSGSAYWPPAPGWIGLAADCGRLLQDTLNIL